jgi:hypothetical protein
MTLRIMLLGLVASLGLELPTRADVEGWATAGAAFACSATECLASPRVEVVALPDLADGTDRHQAEASFDPSPFVGEEAADADMAFAGAAEALASDLSADLAANPIDRSPAEEVQEAIIALEPPAQAAPAEDESAGCLLAEADEADVMPSDQAEATTADEPADRISSAVRLTREAIHAWASLLQSADDDAQPSR